MSRLWSWPALRGAAPHGLPRHLVVEQGIWGKVHGARSDFRWIAATRGFSFRDRDLERELAVGIEDRPVRFPLWRALSGVHFAGICYPSRARDAAGRGGALEKQLFAWRTDRETPAILAALALLPRIAELDDEAWWGQADFSAWDADPRFVLDLGEPREVPVSEGTLEETVREGISSLRATLAAESTEAILADLFSGLLEGRRPVLLSTGGEPLSPEALAVLLLPLERERADRLSLAGWFPSSRPPRQNLGERWDLVARPGDEVRTSGRPSADRRARRMAAALLAGDPPLLSGLRAPEAAPTPPEFRSAGSPPVIESAPRRPVPIRQGETARPSLPRPLSLTEPPAGAGRGWRLLYDLARDPYRFWLDPHDLAPHLKDSPEGTDGMAVQAALSWLRAVVPSGRSSGPAGEQDRAKEDLLRAAILALSPTVAALDALGCFESDRVPPVLYLTALPTTAWERARGALGQERVAELVRQSREHCAPELRPHIEAWLRRNEGTAANKPGSVL